MRARVKDNMNYVKNMDNMAILNTNRAAIAKHEKKIAELKRSQSVDNEINNLKSEVSEIKNMLSQILKAVSDGK